MTSDSLEDVPEGTQLAIGHLAGYLAHTVKKVHKCDQCQQLLSDKMRAQQVTVTAAESDTEEEAIAATFTDLLNRGKLLQPTEMCVWIALQVYQIFKLLVTSP